MRAFAFRLFAGVASLVCVAGTSMGEDADPFSDAYESAGLALDALGDASVALRARDRAAATQSLADAADSAETSMQTLWTTSGSASRIARRLRPYERRFAFRVLNAHAASLDASVTDARLAKAVVAAVRAGTTLTRGFEKSARGKIELRAEAAKVNPSGIWTGTYDPTGGAADAYQWWAVISVSKGVVTATWNSLNGPLGGTVNSTSKAITMHGWVSGTKLYLYNEANATVILRANVVGSSMSGNYIQSDNVTFAEGSAGEGDNDGTFSGSLF